MLRYPFLVWLIARGALGFSSHSSTSRNPQDQSLSVASNPWDELKQVSQNHQEEKGRILFHRMELDESLANSLQQDENIDFQVPTTWSEATKIFWSQRQPQVIGGSILVSLLLRLILYPSLGISDLVAVILTPLAWQLQEWAYHYRNFHGNQGLSYFPFDYHDHHHDLPYFHVSMEPVSVCLGWILSITGVAFCASQVIGIGIGIPHAASTVGTTHVVYLVSSLYYLWVHYLAHSKVPLTGDLQSARAHHIQHHLDRDVNFNMASQTMDAWVGTVPSTVRESKTRSI